ncbi:MAG: hypothetical protein RL329_1798, partial [Bacteroidota bacterium]
MFNLNTILRALAFGGIFIAGIAIAKMWYAPTEVKHDQTSTVLLEHIKTVSKLVTVEGQFAEVFSETDTKQYLKVFTSTKRIILQVKAKVLVGYDLSKMKVEADSTAKTIRISNVPEPMIIAIEPDVKYYDIAQGVFNKFSPEDYNAVQQKSIELIRQQALKSNLMKTAREQGIKNIDVIKVMAD